MSKGLFLSLAVNYCFALQSHSEWVVPVPVFTDGLAPFSLPLPLHQRFLLSPLDSSNPEVSSKEAPHDRALRDQRSLCWLLMVACLSKEP